MSIKGLGCALLPFLNGWDVDMVVYSLGPCWRGQPYKNGRATWFFKKAGIVMMTFWSRAAITAWGFIWVSKKLLGCLTNCVYALAVSDSLWPHGLQPAWFLCLWYFPGKNTGVGCYFLLQGIFLTQELNPLLLPYLLHCRQILYCWTTGGAHNTLWCVKIFNS